MHIFIKIVFFATVFVILFDILLVYSVLKTSFNTGILTFSTVLFAVNGFVFRILYDEYRKHEKNINQQLNLLHAIARKIDLIKVKVGGFKEELNKRIVSPYDIDKINVDYYLNKLDYKFLGVSSRGLLSKLASIDDKIILLNNNNRTLKDVVLFRNPNEDFIQGEVKQYAIKTFMDLINSIRTNSITIIDGELNQFLNEAKSMLKDNWDIK